MRALFAVGGGRSHLYPVLPLAWALRTSGHDVRLAGTPRLADALGATGLPSVTLGQGPRLSAGERLELLSAAYGQPPWPADWPAHPDLLDAGSVAFLEVMGRYVVAVAEGLADGLVAFAHRWRPDLIVYDTVALAGAVAASVHGAASVRYAHGTQAALCVELLPSGEALPGYGRLCERFGLAAVPVPDALIDTLPSSMDIGLELPHLDMRWIPYNGPGVQPDDLDGPRRRPRVCVTWGLTVPGALGEAAADPYRQTIDGIAACGAEILVLTSAEQAGWLGDPPPRVRILTGAPLHSVLPFCDAIVHHGGDGSTMAAAVLGVPQLLITREPNDDLNGGRVAATGVGIHLRHQRLDGGPGGVEVIRDAVDRLLSHVDFAAAASRLREEIERQPAPTDVAATLAARA